MALIRIFDYIYYRVYHIYKIKWKDNTPGAYATSLVTLLQSILFVGMPIFIYPAICGTKATLDKKYYIGAFLLFFIFNYLRYSKVTNYESLSIKWNDEEGAKRRKKGVYIVLFIIFTLVVFFGLVTILGKINRGEL